jgi:hypothetical protein
MNKHLLLALPILLHDTTLAQANFSSQAGVTPKNTSFKAQLKFVKPALAAHLL